MALWSASHAPAIAKLVAECQEHDDRTSAAALRKLAKAARDPDQRPVIEKKRGLRALIIILATRADELRWRACEVLKLLGWDAAIREKLVAAKVPDRLIQAASLPTSSKTLKAYALGALCSFIDSPRSGTAPALVELAQASLCSTDQASHRHSAEFIQIWCDRLIQQTEFEHLNHLIGRCSSNISQLLLSPPRDPSTTEASADLDPHAAYSLALTLLQVASTNQCPLPSALWPGVARMVEVGSLATAGHTVGERSILYVRAAGALCHVMAQALSKSNCPSAMMGWISEFAETVPTSRPPDSAGAAQDATTPALRLLPLRRIVLLLEDKDERSSSGPAHILATSLAAAARHRASQGPELGEALREHGAGMMRAIQRIVRRGTATVRRHCLHVLLLQQLIDDQTDENQSDGGVTTAPHEMSALVEALDIYACGENETGSTNRHQGLERFILGRSSPPFLPTSGSFPVSPVSERPLEMELVLGVLELWAHGPEEIRLRAALLMQTWVCSDRTRRSVASALTHDYGRGVRIVAGLLRWGPPAVALSAAVVLNRLQDQPLAWAVLWCCEDTASAVLSRLHWGTAGPVVHPVNLQLSNTPSGSPDLDLRVRQDGVSVPLLPLGLLLDPVKGALATSAAMDRRVELDRRLRDSPAARSPSVDGVLPGHHEAAEVRFVDDSFPDYWSHWERQFTSGSDGAEGWSSMLRDAGYSVDEGQERAWAAAGLVAEAAMYEDMLAQFKLPAAGQTNSTGVLNLQLDAGLIKEVIRLLTAGRNMACSAGAAEAMLSAAQSWLPIHLKCLERIAGGAAATPAGEKEITQGFAPLHAPHSTMLQTMLQRVYQRVEAVGIAEPALAAAMGSACRALATASSTQVPAEPVVAAAKIPARLSTSGVTATTSPDSSRALDEQGVTADALAGLQRRSGQGSGDSNPSPAKQRESGPKAGPGRRRRNPNAPYVPPKAKPLLSASQAGLRDTWWVKVQRMAGAGV